MSPVPASAITIADGEITIDAGLLAPAGQHRSPKSARPRQDRVMMMVFLALLVVGFVYEWMKGALQWE